MIQKGITTIKNVGDKAAEFIANERKEHGDFKDIDDFIDRCKNRSVTSRVIDALEKSGALCFNKKKWYSMIKKYNVSILAKDRR